MDRVEEVLERLVGGFAFDFSEIGLVVLAGVVPVFGDGGDVGAQVFYAWGLESGCLYQLFVKAGGGEDEEAHGPAARHHLIAAYHACDHNGVGEEDAATGLEDPPPFSQDFEAVVEVVYGVNADHGVEGGVLEGKGEAGIALAEGGLGGEAL